MREWYLGLNSWAILFYALLASVLLQWVLTRAVLVMTRRTATELDDTIVARLRFPIFLTVLFIGAMIALRRWDPPFGDTTVWRTRNVLITIATLFWIRSLRRIGDAVCDALARKVDDFNWIQPQSLPIYEILSGLLVIGAGIYVVLVAWEVDLTAWLASAGIIGIAVGFAARDTLANLFAGMFILADAPYRLGDYIVLDGQERGKVTQIGIRSTRLLTRDDIEITIPNSVIANSKIVNETGGPHQKRRVRIQVGVAYGSDIDRVREVLMEIARDSGLAAEHPEPRVRFRNLGDSSLDFHLQIWIDEPALRGRAVDQLLTAIYKRFNEEGIEIPFPQRVVTMQPS
ncbi:MAG: mechanosensitive ion channel family protein [Planctomycetota bacterium]|jgi:small-conductance mechanosensitive channel